MVIVILKTIMCSFPHICFYNNETILLVRTRECSGEMLGSFQPRFCTNFFPAPRPSLKKGSIRLISSTHCSSTVQEPCGPKPFTVPCSLCFQLVNAKETGVGREKHRTGIQLKEVSPFNTLYICHILQPDNNRIFNTPLWLLHHLHDNTKYFPGTPKP